MIRKAIRSKPMDILEKIQAAKKELELIQELESPEDKTKALLFLNVKLDFYTIELEDLEDLEI